MHKQIVSVILGVFILLSVCSRVASAAETTDQHAADRLALRTLLKDVENAINANEISRLLPYLDDHIVITHQNAHVARGKDEVISYNEQMTKGPAAPIRKLTTQASIGGPAYFHGDNLAVGYGTAVDQIELRSGQSFALEVAWSATLVKKGGVWKAAAIHFSTNVLDNAILRQTKKLAWLAAGGTLLLGLLLGWFFGRRRAE